MLPVTTTANPSMLSIKFIALINRTIQVTETAIFKIFPKHVETIKAYNKLLLIRNSLLENNQETFQWDKKIIKVGYLIWEERKLFFKYL